ncbi:MAG: hypothetical protein HQL07_09920 [Nitrospirae bacterium]|nr:hypothetical protein [Magnetococcales bacterium]HAT50357.1 hypothetical protein [Alphaproteobacteria bacterium]
MIQSGLGRQMSLMQGLVALYLIFLVIFFAAAPFLTLWLYAEADLSRSLLPQLIGFCLQGAFLVVVFAIYEKRTTVHGKRSHKFALRSAIGSLLRPLGRVNEGAARGGFLAPTALMQIHQDITEGGLSQGVCEELEANALKVLVSLESLSVLAAQIDAQHLEAWGAMLQAIRGMSEAHSQGETQEMVLELIDAVRDFDELYIY